MHRNPNDNKEHQIVPKKDNQTTKGKSKSFLSSQPNNAHTSIQGNINSKIKYLENCQLRPTQHETSGKKEKKTSDLIIM